MNRTTKLLGSAALLAWTTLGIVGWAVVARGVGERLRGDEPESAPSTELLTLSDQLDALHEDVRAIARAMGENLQTLHDELDARLEARAAELGAEVTRLQSELAAHREGELARISRELELRGSDRSSDPDGAPSAPATSVAIATQEVEPTPSAAAFEPAAPATPVTPGPARKSFLAFELPSDQLRFEGRRTWTVLPALSRVGFDAKSTLHDFTGTTSRIEGTLELDPSRPMDAPHALLRVQAASLATGVDGRDEAMREHLATDEHPELVFELEAFDAAEVDAAAERTAGTARGRITIRGVTRAVAMPVKLALDQARRLSLEGEMQLHLPDFGVPVPNKLGVISMEEDVKVWIAIKLRASSRTEG